MKRNSRFEVPLVPFRLSPSTNSGDDTQSPFSPSRRSLLATAGLFFLTPRQALARLFQCGPDLRIAVLAPITGDFAGHDQRLYLEGVQQAVKTAKAHGCNASIIVRDADTPPKQEMAARMAAGPDRSSAIIAPFGPVVGRYVAQRVPSVLILDILQASPFGPRPPNYAALPYALFFTANPQLRSESLRTVGRVAANIVLETIMSSDLGKIKSPSDMIEAMARRKFNSPKGTLTFNRYTGAFELIK
jgi:hypothetical protein